MLVLEPQDLKIIGQIIAKYPYKFYAYGSRVKNTHKKFSDLDICIMENINLSLLENIKEEFIDSDITIKIELKRWQDLSDDFKSLIQDDLMLLEL